MKIKIVSDLHLEFSDYNVKNDDNCDVLILSGDIMIAEYLHDHPGIEPGGWYSATGDMGHKQLMALRSREFLSRCSFQFPHVIYVAGNHELYHGKWVQGIQYLRDECAKYPNVYFLERDCKQIDDVLFLGGTLWTDCNKYDPLTLHALQGMMYDFKGIRNDDKGYTKVKPADTAERHKQTLGYFKNVLEGKDDVKCVVVSHHSPSFQSCHEKYKAQTLMNGGYHSDLSEFILDRPQIKLWTHGHTHDAFDYHIGETRIICNPRGYESDGYEEQTGWNPNLIVEV